MSDLKQNVDVNSIKKLTWQPYVDARGSLGAIEYPDTIPFAVQRIFYLYGVNQQAERGNHAHRSLQQFIICMSGSCEVSLTDISGKTQKFHLGNPNEGLFIPPMIWTTLTRFSQNAVCLILASEKYDDNDYIRNYETFLTGD